MKEQNPIAFARLVLCARRELAGADVRDGSTFRGLGLAASAIEPAGCDRRLQFCRVQGELDAGVFLNGIGAEEYVVLYVEDRRHSKTASPAAPGPSPKSSPGGL